MKELKSLLEHTDGSDEEFVLYTMALVRDKPDLKETFVKFLKENPDVTADSFSDYTDGFLFDENGQLLPEFICND